MNFTLALDSSTPVEEPRPQAAAPTGRVAPATAAPVRSSPGWGTKRRHPGALIAIGALHLVAGWALAHGMMHRASKAEPAPVQVRLLEAPKPPQVTPPPPKMQVTLPILAPMPIVPPPPVTISSPVVVVAESLPTTSAPPRPEPAPAVAVAAAPVAPPAIRELPAGSFRYRVEPRLSYPRMSKRLGEAGVVVLRIVVDAAGMLRSATLKRSSGFERLDQQALLDIRSARFEPYLERGHAIDWEADAGLSYELN